MKLLVLPIKLYSLLIRKRDDSNIYVYNTVFSKYLILPMMTFPLYELSRPRSDISFRDKKIVYRLTINPLYMANRTRIGTYRLEDDKSTINL